MIHNLRVVCLACNRKAQDREGRRRRTEEEARGLRIEEWAGAREVKEDEKGRRKMF